MARQLTYSYILKEYLHLKKLSCWTSTYTLCCRQVSEDLLGVLAFLFIFWGSFLEGKCLGWYVESHTHVCAMDLFLWLPMLFSAMLGHLKGI